MTKTNNKCCEKCKPIGQSGKISTPWCGKFGKCECHETNNKEVGDEYKRELASDILFRFYYTYSRAIMASGDDRDKIIESAISEILALLKTNTPEREDGCRCGRPDLHYKFTNGECPVPEVTDVTTQNTVNIEGWEIKFDKTFGPIPGKYRAFIKPWIRSLFASQRHSLKEERDDALVLARWRLERLLSSSSFRKSVLRT